MRLPRVASFTIERERVTSWLARHDSSPLRLLLAPAGSGKTTALVRYAETHKDDVCYVHLKYRPEGRSLEDDLCELAELQSFNYARFLSVLTTRQRVELVIDGIDHLHPDEEALLERLVYDIPAHVALIYAGTKSKIPIHRLEAAGLVQIYPRTELLFTTDDTRALCVGLGLSARPEDVVALNECTDGWPAAVADVLRCAVEHDTAIVDAYDRWTERRGRSFTSYIQEELGRLPAELQAIVEKSVRGYVANREEFGRLEAAGAFMLISDTGARPYNIVSYLLDRPAPVPALNDTLISMRMFGRFSIRCGDREVAWIRRRDQQIFRFIAVRSSGRVAKSEIIDIFWPGADPHLAAQSLRTACSNIRKALAAVIGTPAMERLFVTDGQEIYVNGAQITVDVRRFKAHINEGNEAENADRPSDAVAHFSAANRLYRADLFSGEPEEAWFVPQREVYRDMVRLARERVEALRAEIESTDRLAATETRV